MPFQLSFALLFLSFFLSLSHAQNITSSFFNTSSSSNSSLSDPFNLSVAINALYFCKAAYCPVDEIKNWNCGIACEVHAKLTDIVVYGNDTMETQGFSGYDPTTNHIIMSFRGSANLKNWIANLDFLFIDYPIAACTSCRVHRGFLSTFGSLIDQVTENMIILMQKYPNAENILATGHSLGAAIAYLTAVQLNYEALLLHSSADLSLIPMYVYTFGLPRVGNQEFNTWALESFAKSNSNFYRITHHADPVPHLPPLMFGYIHAPTEVFYDDNSENHYSVCNDNFDGEDDDCSNHYTLAPSVSDHLRYLDRPTGCTDD